MCDNDSGLTNAVRARFPDAELYLCEWHLRHALERLMGKLRTEDVYRDAIDELLPQVEPAFTGPSFWAPFIERAHAAGIPRVSEWLNTTGQIVAEQFSRRGLRWQRPVDTPLIDLAAGRVHQPNPRVDPAARLRAEEPRAHQPDADADAAARQRTRRRVTPTRT